jgi:2-polyprenyl-6-methoxyphenol hydroxylase-like FAD-dependent oxidoreductase
MADATGPDTLWPTPEHTHRVNQKFFEPVLFARVAAQPRVRILNRTEVDTFTQYDRGVSAVIRNLDSGQQMSIDCSYLVGCDGASSMVRWQARCGSGAAAPTPAPVLALLD